MFSTDSLGVVVLFVDLDFIGEFGDVGDIDLHGAVAQRFHELIVLQLPVFGFVGVADDDFVDIGLREFLRFDLMFLACAEQVIQEGNFELQDFDEFNDAAIGDIELAIEIERASIRVRAVDGDLAIVDIAGQFRRVLIFLVLRLECADADAVFFRQNQTAHLHVIHNLEPIAFIAARQFAIHLAARRAQVAFHLDRKLRIPAVAHEFIDQLFALAGRNQVQGFFAHRAGQLIVQHRVDFLLDIVGDIRPRERVHGAIGSARIFFEALLEQPHDGALGAADRAVK